MAEIETNDITFGLGVFGIVILSIIAVIAIIGVIYFSYTKDILTSLYFSIINFIRLFFLNNEAVVKSDICAIIPSNDPVPRIPSLFTAHVSFFFGFLLANAIYLYKYTNEDTKGIETQVKNRKTRAATSIGLLILIFLFIMIVRINTTQCESLSGIVFTSFIFGGLGNLWYKVGEVCGLQLTDIFGVSQSIISTRSHAPVVCAEVT